MNRCVDKEKDYTNISPNWKNYWNIMFRIATYSDRKTFQDIVHNKSINKQLSELVSNNSRDSEINFESFMFALVNHQNVELLNVIINEDFEGRSVWSEAIEKGIMYLQTPRIARLFVDRLDCVKILKDHVGLSYIALQVMLDEAEKSFAVDTVFYINDVLKTMV